MNNLSEIAAIILNYNAGEMTASCISKLLNVADGLTVITVDNCSSDGSGDLLEKRFAGNPNVFVVRNQSNAGYASGNNVGLRYLQENFPEKKYGLVLNPDVEIKEKKTIEAMRVELEKNPDVSVVSVKMLYNGNWRGFFDCAWKFPGTNELFWSGTFLQKPLKKSVNNDYCDGELNMDANPVDVVTGCFFMARMSDISKVDFMDESTFLYFEESILAKKLKRIGKREMLLTNVQAFHNHVVKDQNLKNYKKRLEDRRFFHESKMYYIKEFSEMKGLSRTMCLIVNNLDFLLKKIAYGTLSLGKR